MQSIRNISRDKDRKFLSLIFDQVLRKKNKLEGEQL